MLKFGTTDMNWRKYLNPLKTIATVYNPVAGAVLEIADMVFVKPVKKTEKIMNGNKTYIGVIVTVLAFIAQYLGYDVPIEAQDGVEKSLSGLVLHFSGLLTAIGIVHKIDKATKK